MTEAIEKQLAQKAIDCQDASNINGIARFLVRTLDELNGLGVGKPEHHPSVRAIINKIEHLSGMVQATNGIGECYEMLGKNGKKQECYIVDGALNYISGIYNARDNTFKILKATKKDLAFCFDNQPSAVDFIAKHEPSGENWLTLLKTHA